MPLGARLWHYAAELRTLSVTYPLCGSALTDTTDNPSEMCPLRLTDFCLFLYHRSYTILQRPLIPPMAFTSCHDRGSNRLSPDGSASTLTTQPLRLALLSVTSSIKRHLGGTLPLVYTFCTYYITMCTHYTTYKRAANSSQPYL